MPSQKNEKKLTSIKNDISSIQAMWVVDYRGLTVKDTEILRRSIHDADASMKVYKNTLVELALKELNLPNISEILVGPSAFIFTEGDPVASAKVLKEFADNNDNLVIKGGIMDDAFISTEVFEKIAALPSHEELIAQLIGTIQNPLTKIVRVLNGPMESLVRAIQAIEDQKVA